MPLAIRYACSVVFALVMLGGTARADDPPLGRPVAPTALEHLSRGNQLYKVRSFEEAAAEYRAGALIESAQIFDYNLGQCYRQLGRYKDAIWHYELLLKRIPDTGERADAVRKFIAQMKAELDKKAMTEPPTEVAPSAATPSRPGSANLDAQQQRAVGAGHVQPWYADAFGWGLTSAGLVGGAVSIGLFVSASSLNDDANHAASQSEAGRLHEKADTRLLLGTVIGIGGAGLLVTGVIKLVIHPSEPERATTARWDVGASSSSVFVFGRF